MVVRTLNKNIKAWDRLSIARMIERPNAEDYIKLIFNNFLSYMEIEIIGMINLLLAE